MRLWFSVFVVAVFLSAAPSARGEFWSAASNGSCYEFAVTSNYASVGCWEWALNFSPQVVAEMRAHAEGADCGVTFFVEAGAYAYTDAPEALGFTSANAFEVSCAHDSSIDYEGNYYYHDYGDCSGSCIDAYLY
jgi:hypothetical protein